MSDPAPVTPEDCLRALMSGGPSSTGLSGVALQRREQIMDAAEAIIAGMGIHKLSLAAIEERAGMSRGQLTYYFATKEAILLAVFERMLYRMIAQDLQKAGPKPLTGHAWECLEHGLSEHLKPGTPHPGEKELFSLLYTFLAQMAHREDYRDRLSKLYRDWRGLIAADVAGSVPAPPVPPPIVASLIQATLHGLGMQLAADPEAFDRGEMLAACLRMFAPLFNRTPSDTDPAPKGGES